ncbi:MAG: hypothetical protein ACP5XB_30060 [Isosphaeraceae bacterium]
MPQTIGGGGGVSFMGFGGAYWNATPGAHSVYVSVTYTDGSTGQASATCTVVAPTVNSFSVTYGPTEWAGLPTGDNTGTAFSSGMTFSASLTAPQSAGGKINVIQMVSANSSEINQTVSGGQATHTMTTPGAVLDNVPNWTQPTDPGYVDPSWGASVGANGTASLPGTATDSPTLGWKWGPTTETATLDVRMDVTFQDYLVYQPSGGIWVQIAVTPSYTASGEEKYVGGQGWQQVAAPSPAQEAALQGNPSLGFVQWSDYVHPKYDTWTPIPT